MGKLEKELEVLATASVQSQDVCDLTQGLPVSQSAAETAAWLHCIHS